MKLREDTDLNVAISISFKYKHIKWNGISCLFFIGSIGQNFTNMQMRMREHDAFEVLHD